MPIKYCCVNSITDAGNTKLGEHPADEQPTLAETLQKVFATATAKDFRRRSLEDKKNGVNYHTLANGDGKVIGCVVTSDVQARVAYSFLEAVEALVRPENIDSRLTTKILQQKADFFSDPKNDKFNAINKELLEVTAVVQGNVEDLIIRGDKINNIHGKSVNVADQAQVFADKSEELKSKLCWRNAKLVAMAAAGVGVLIIVIVLLAKS